jgi:hypothetical protein
MTMSKHFTQVVFSVFDGQQRLGHVTKSASAKKGFDVFIGDEFVGTAATKEAAHTIILNACDGKESRR